jgi:hypothetical protein
LQLTGSEITEIERHPAHLDLYEVTGEKLEKLLGERVARDLKVAETTFGLAVTGLAAASSGVSSHWKLIWIAFTISVSLMSANSFISYITGKCSLRKALRELKHRKRS